tara:strand:+ start:134 stop:319 length:186 start_codon:yes stop_codon:yes gene_type:complete
MSDLAFDADLPNGWQVQVTENYEGDRYHVVVFDNNVGEHDNTLAADTPDQLINILREVSQY